MKLFISDLSQHLKQPLKPFYFIFGDEPLQRMEASDAIHAAALKQGYTEQESYEITVHFEWEHLKSSLSALSLFAEKRFIHCRFRDDKLNKESQDALIDLSANLPSDTLILCQAAKIDAASRKSKWFTLLEKNAVVIAANPLTPQAFTGWLKNRLRQANLNATEGAVSALTERSEGNLLAAAKAIEILSLYAAAASIATSSVGSSAASASQGSPLSPSLKTSKASLPVTFPITEKEVAELITVSSRFSLFDLADACLQGSVVRTKQIFASLKSESVEPILVLWAITREVRSIIPLARFLEKGGSLSQGLTLYPLWKHKVESVTSFLSQVTVSFLHHILLQAKSIDSTLKGRTSSFEDPWIALYSLCLTLTRREYKYV